MVKFFLTGPLDLAVQVDHFLQLYLHSVDLRFTTALGPGSDSWFRPSPKVFRHQVGGAPRVN